MAFERQDGKLTVRNKYFHKPLKGYTLYLVSLTPGSASSSRNGTGRVHGGNQNAGEEALHGGAGPLSADQEHAFEEV
ncbi:hypothetical protein, partial [Akkermansia sp.]|uniref:hypothetical protein n=1 Tax=Akkermansia sp. TaxID=1872421 RepID=UPI003AB40A15